MKDINWAVLNSVVRRAHYLANQMIFDANHRSDKEKGDPKVGGHCSASSSAIHLLGAIHLVAKSGFDFIANKPHASPADHAYNYLLDLLLDDKLARLPLDECNKAMGNLRAFSKTEPVFQSYHSAYDPDHHNFLPSGTVGIPPVNLGYLAHAYRFARKQGYEVPKARFWALMGDAEFREGSLFEAVPDFAERELAELTWIVDYNRQSLDGHRITNPKIMGGSDAHRMFMTMKANGWHTINLQHGSLREKLFQLPGGEAFKNWLEGELPDYELQSMLLVKSDERLYDHIKKNHGSLGTFLKSTNPKDLRAAISDFGGHDLQKIVHALEEAKAEVERPTFIVAHTLKGWGLEMAATSGNHSALIEEDELAKLRDQQKIKSPTTFARFDTNTPEGQFCRARGEQLFAQIKEQHAIRDRNLGTYGKKQESVGEIPTALDINLKLASYPHTQWMLGQLTSKLTRIANAPLKDGDQGEGKALPASEHPWKAIADLIVSMAPDVGTSTNLNPSMDGKIYGAEVTPDIEATLEVKDKKTPDLVPGSDSSDRFIRFDIEEGNCMSAMGSYGKIRDLLGIPVMPLMTVYDFFVKRALDQFFYNLYWKSSFILVGTPSGVTLSPEGAQHGWKSDFQIPNQITWEPFFCQELDWILSDAIRRHATFDNDGRTGVFVRGVTRGIEQKDMLKYLRRQRRFKKGLQEPDALVATSHMQHLSAQGVGGMRSESEIESLGDAEILSRIQQEVLSGAYYLIDYRGYFGYEPGDNVVNIFSLGSPTTEAIKASDTLLERGIFANVIVVTCTDLLVGNLGHADNYRYLREGIGANGRLYLTPKDSARLDSSQEVVTLSGRRVPSVSVHDGEPGLLDNLGSIVGVRHEALAVRKHSKCGRPKDIYEYHGIDASSIIEACGYVLSETALEEVVVHRSALGQAAEATKPAISWRELWPSVKQH